MTFSVTILGSSSAIPTSTRSLTAQVVNIHERFFLIDCGEGSQVQMRKYRVNLGKINHILISHLHGDHIFGIFGLLSSLSLMGKNGTLHIYCDAKFEYILEQHLLLMETELGFEIKYHHLTPGKSEIIYDDRIVRIKTIPLKHRTHTWGFLFMEKQKELNIKKEAISKFNLGIKDIVRVKKGEDHVTPSGKVIPVNELTLPPYGQRSYAFCSDTRYTRSIITLIKGVSLLYHEATFLHRDVRLAKETLHSTALEAAKIANEAGAGKLLLGHFSVRYKNINEFENEAREVFANVTAVTDGETYSIPLERVS